MATNANCVAVRLNVEGAAKHIGFSKSWLDKERASGRGPRYFRIGSRVFYRIADLDQWLESRAVETEDSRSAA